MQLGTQNATLTSKMTTDRERFAKKKKYNDEQFNLKTNSSTRHNTVNTTLLVQHTRNGTYPQVARKFYIHNCIIIILWVPAAVMWRRSVLVVECSAELCSRP